MIRVLLIDDDYGFRQALARLLELQLDIEVVGLAARSLDEARRKLRDVEVALVDRGLPDGDSLELIGDLREANPGASVLVMSATVEAARP